jgi:hypothetical protein
MTEREKITSSNKTRGIILMLIGIILVLAGDSIAQNADITILKLATIQWSIPGWDLGVALFIAAEIPIILGLWKYFKRVR